MAAIEPSDDDRIKRDIESSRELMYDYGQLNDVAPRFGLVALSSLLLGSASTVTVTVSIPTSYSFYATTVPKPVSENPFFNWHTGESILFMFSRR